MQTQPAQEIIWKEESRIIGSGIPAPTADWPSEVSRTPFSSQSEERKEECGGKATPESKDNASLITGASDYYPKCVAHGWLHFGLIINLEPVFKFV